MADESNWQWFRYDVDASRWLDWHRQYIQKLAAQDWLDSVAMTQILIQSITSNSIVIDRLLCFIGFDELTPLQQQLQSWLVKNNHWQGGSVQDHSPGSVTMLAAGDPLSETQQAVVWARDQFENHWQEGDMPIGIIVPRLEQYRVDIERILREVFYPQDNLKTLIDQSLHTQGLREDTVFNISLGRSLGQEPVIATCLRVLQLCRRSFHYEDFSRVLRSPFIVDAEKQRASRSMLDYQLRRKVTVNSHLQLLISSIHSDEADHIRQLLADLLAMQQGWKGKASARTWADRFQRCLNLFGLFGPDCNDTAACQPGYQYQVMRSLDEVWLAFSPIGAGTGTDGSGTSIEHIRANGGKPGFSTGCR